MGRHHRRHRQLDPDERLPGKSPGHGLYNRSRRVDFRVRSGCREFDVEAKFQEKSGTADQLAWVALKVAERNEFPLYLVIGGKVMVEECLDELKEAADSSCYDHLHVGTLDDFARWLGTI